MIILLFLSAVFAPAPLPLPIQQTAAILPETHHKFGPASKHQNLKLSKEQQLVKLNALYALPDDIQVKIISDTQNAQNAIQWLKMNKGSSDKLIKDPNFQPMLPEVLKLSFLDKYYDADIVKQILNEPNLVNWNLKGVQSDAKHVMDIETFAKVIKDVDLSSAAGRQFKEYSLMNIGKFIDENPGKSLELMSKENFDIMAKIILSDSKFLKKFTNDLSLAPSTDASKSLTDSIKAQNLYTFKLILHNSKVTDKIPTEVFHDFLDSYLIQFIPAPAIRGKEYRYFKTIISNNQIASRLDIDFLFKRAMAINDKISLELMIKNPKLFDILKIETINEGFIASSKDWFASDKFMLYVKNIKNIKLSEKLLPTSIEKAFENAVEYGNYKIISALLDATDLWKNAKFSPNFREKLISKLDIDFLFKRAVVLNDEISVQLMIKNPKLFDKVTSETINEGFIASSKDWFASDTFMLYVKNIKLSEKLLPTSIEKAFENAVEYGNYKIISALLDATDLWKNAKFSSNFREKLISKLDNDSLFNGAVKYNDEKSLQLMLTKPEFLDKLKIETINEGFIESSKYSFTFDTFILYVKNIKLSEKLLPTSIEKAFENAVENGNYKSISALLDATDLWKNAKFSPNFREKLLSIARWDIEIQQLFERNRSFMDKLREIESK